MLELFLFFILLQSFTSSHTVCAVLPIYSKMELCVTVIVSDKVFVVLPIYSKIELCVTVIMSPLRTKGDISF